MKTPESQQEIALKNMERAEAREARLVWAGSLANGALLIALIGLIGNVARPDDAIQFLRWPLVFLGLGVVVGGGTAYAFSRLGRIFLRGSGAAIDASRAELYMREDKLEFAVRAAIQAVCNVSGKSIKDLGIQLSEIHTVEDYSKLSTAYGDALKRDFKARKIWKRVSDVCFFASFNCLSIACLIAATCFAQGYRLQP